MRYILSYADKLKLRKQTGATCSFYAGFQSLDGLKLKTGKSHIDFDNIKQRKDFIDEVNHWEELQGKGADIGTSDESFIDYCEYKNYGLKYPVNLWDDIDSRFVASVCEAHLKSYDLPILATIYTDSTYGSGDRWLTVVKGKRARGCHTIAIIGIDSQRNIGGDIGGVLVIDSQGSGFCQTKKANKCWLSFDYLSRRVDFANGISNLKNVPSIQRPSFMLLDVMNKTQDIKKQTEIIEETESVNKIIQIGKSLLKKIFC